MSPNYYTGIPSVQACVELCKGLEGCAAVTFLTSNNRCFVKHAGYGAAAPETLGRAPISVELSCLELECMEDKDDGASSCTSPTTASCTYTNQVLPGAQISPGYYDGIASFNDCINKCRSLKAQGCKAIVYMPKVPRCYVKKEGYKAATPDTLGRQPLSMEMSCLEAKCTEDLV